MLALALVGISCLRTDNPFAPNGTSLMKYGRGQYIFMSTFSNVYRWDLATGNNVKGVLTTNGYEFISLNVQVSKDERYFYTLAQKTAAGYIDLYRYNIDGTGEELILAGSAASTPNLVYPCPNGDLIIKEITGVNSETIVINPYYATKRDLIGSNINVSVPLAGKAAFYYSTNMVGSGPYTNTYTIKKYDLAAKTTATIATMVLEFSAPPNPVFSIGPSPDGDKLLIITQTNSANFLAYMLDVRSGAAPALIGSITNSVSIGWSPYASPLYMIMSAGGYEIGRISTANAALTKTKEFTLAYVMMKWPVSDAFGKMYLVNTNLAALGAAESMID